MSLIVFDSDGAIVPVGGEGIISIVTHNAGRLSPGATEASTVNWPAANQARYCKIILPSPVMVTQLWWMNGTAVTGNVDVGIYDFATLQKLCSTGSVALSGTSAIQKATLTNPVYLPAGSYLMAQARDSGGATNTRAVQYTRTALVDAELYGGMMESSAFPLPATATPVAMSGTFTVPLMGAFTNLCGL